MKYQFERNNNIFFDLQHISWFLEHESLYNFGFEAEEKKLKLENALSRKNVYYSTAVDTYKELTSLFDNSPYNYKTELLGNDGIDLTSAEPDGYLVEWEAGGDTYTVPVGFLKDHVGEDGITQQEIDWKNETLVNQSRYDCKIVLDEIRRRENDAYNASQEFRDSFIDGIKDAAKKQKSDLRWLFGAWLALLLTIGRHPWFNGIFSALHIARKRECISGTAAVVSGIFLLFMLAVMVMKSIWAAKKQFMVLRMKQIVKHMKSLLKYQALPEQVRASLEVRPDQRIEKEVHVKELSEVLEQSRARYVFSHLKSISPADYPHAYPEIGKWLPQMIIILSVVGILL